jgi:hypothetical protein
MVLGAAPLGFKGAGFDFSSVFVRRDPSAAGGASSGKIPGSNFGDDAFN